MFSTRFLIAVYRHECLNILKNIVRMSSGNAEIEQDPELELIEIVKWMLRENRSSWIINLVTGVSFEEINEIEKSLY